MTQPPLALPLMLVLAGCVQGGSEGAVMPTGQADRFEPWQGTPPEEAMRLLPPGVPDSALRLGNDGCFYHLAGGRMQALRFPGNATDHYCIG